MSYGTTNAGDNTGLSSTTKALILDWRGTGRDGIFQIADVQAILLSVQLDTSLMSSCRAFAPASYNPKISAFNVLNQVNYALASSGLSSGASGFGVVNASTTFPARVLQFAGKIIF